jgi:hypothetical protein
MYLIFSLIIILYKKLSPNIIFKEIDTDKIVIFNIKLKIIINNAYYKAHTQKGKNYNFINVINYQKY